MRFARRWEAAGGSVAKIVASYWKVWRALLILARDCKGMAGSENEAVAS